MSDPTKAELAELLAEHQAKVKALLSERENIDGEARAYDRCVAALSKLTATGRSYDSKGFDKNAIRRVVDALTARFALNEAEELLSNTYFSAELESMPDPRSEVISQLIDALRRQ